MSVVSGKWRMSRRNCSILVVYTFELHDHVWLMLRAKVSLVRVYKAAAATGLHSPVTLAQESFGHANAPTMGRSENTRKKSKAINVSNIYLFSLWAFPRAVGVHCLSLFSLLGRKPLHGTVYMPPLKVLNSLKFTPLKEPCVACSLQSPDFIMRMLCWAMAALHVCCCRWITLVDSLGSSRESESRRVRLKKIFGSTSQVSSGSGKFWRVLSEFFLLLT